MHEPYHSTRVHRFESASLTLGIAALLCLNVPFTSIVCAALAIIFASLSRGGMMSYTSRAQAGMVLGIVALVLMALLFLAVFAFLLMQDNDLEELLKMYAQVQGISYDELMQMFTE